MFKNLFAIILIGLGSTTAQTFSGKLNPFPVYTTKNITADTLKILAVMVNFAEDKDASTFGNGKFGTLYSKDYSSDILDPLPHNKDYFDAHLQFAKNYFKKVSGDRLNIIFNVLPDTFSVSKTMRNYSPPVNSQDFTLLADFASEVWTKADQLYPGFNFSDFDIFLIFHAGVGRDISLPGSLGNERDMPSVYLGENALKKLKGNAFTGFPVSGGAFNITNSMIIPETESRELESFGTTVLFEITINGLITASIASHLGLPDLFDTKTGLSAIGRFGLMDGQAIFAYNGLFPPEPSAWEKIYLGWAEPVTLFPGNYNLALTAKAAAGISDTVIFKIPISSSEYYLVENRNRDVNNDGAILSLVQNGQVVNTTFRKDTAGFYSFAVDSVDGVLTDIDEYDWSLPGLIDDTSAYKGGIVVWHIDENVIQSKIAQNEINTEKNNRGVDVEEADGIQDIGERFTTIFGDEVIGEGTYEDYWFLGNPAKLFANVFSFNTRPKSISNYGANTLITMRNFSTTGNRMTFDVTYGDSLVKPVFARLLPGNNTQYFINKASNNNFNIISGKDLFVVSASGIVTNTFTNFSAFKPVTFTSDNNEYTIGAIDSTVNIVENGAILRSFNSIGSIKSPVTVLENGSVIKIIFSTNSGAVHIYNFNAAHPQLFELSGSYHVHDITHFAAEKEYMIWGGQSNNLGIREYQVLYNISFPNPNESSTLEYTGEGNLIKLGLTKKKDGSYLIISLSDKELAIFSTSNGKKEVLLSNQNITSFAITDLKNDGENYILFNNGNKLNAINISGANAEGFPFTDPLGKNFTGTPLAADFSGDTKSEVISYTEDGRIFAFNGADGKVVNSFPISAGKMVKSSALFVSNNKISLAVVDSTNRFYGWNIGPTPGTLYWSEENGNNQNTSFVSTAASGNFVNIFFPKDKVYNYPNPVYGAETAIRYYVSENSRVNVKIFDLAGDFVAELNGDGNGGLENEILWNVASIQSGIYLARVEATGDSGKKEQSIIKIAIVK